MVPFIPFPKFPASRLTSPARFVSNLSKKVCKMNEIPFQLDASVLASVANAVNRIQQSLETGYKSVTDEAFSKRLEKALERNLNYIRR